MKIKAFFSILLLASVLSLQGCGAAASYTDKTVFGMDTYTTLRLADGGVDGETVDLVAEECAYIIAKNEKIMSSHDEESHVYAFNTGIETILEPAEELSEVISSALSLAWITDGAFDPTMGALTELWNVTGGGPVPDDGDIEDALETVGYKKLTISREDGSISKEEGVKLDLGGIAKGYTVQEIVEHLEKSEISYGLVSMGGNIGVFGEKSGGAPFKVGIGDPDNRESVVGYLMIDSGYISVSGDYERFFEENGERYHHIIDRRNGYPAESGLRSVAVWAKDGATADALSTALFVMGERDAFSLYRSGKVDFEAIMITNAGEIVLTDGLADEMFELSEAERTVRGASGVEIKLAE